MDMQLSRDPVVEAMASSMALTLPTRRPRHGEALRLPVAVIIALELYVLKDEAPLYFKFLACVRLVKVWCCFRWDDLLGTGPD